MNQTSSLPSNLPAKPFITLFGRREEIKHLLNALTDRNSDAIIVISGMGGIGKTALALEVADICINQKLFDSVIWNNFQQEQFFSGIVRSRISPEFGIDDVIERIAYTLTEHDLLKLDKSQRKQRVLKLLQEKKLLLILDSLDFNNNYSEQILLELRAFINPTKVLITSRGRPKNQDQVHSIHLDGLSKLEALEFFKHEAHGRGNDLVSVADDVKLAQIIESIGRSPLAIKLAVSQLLFHPLEVVAKQLRSAGDANSDISSFYRFIFLPAWNHLSDDGKKLLIALSVFHPGVGGTLEAIKAVSAFDEYRLNRSLAELYGLSLIELSEDAIRKEKRFSLHPLTFQFILSDIVNAD